LYLNILAEGGIMSVVMDIILLEIQLGEVEDISDN
jgi:hypothetical protein